MMFRYAIYSTENGRVLREVVCVAFAVLGFIGEKENALPIPGPILGDAYVENGYVVYIPVRPSASHVWSWENKRWELNDRLAALALNKAVQDALNGIDQAAGQARLKYITSVPGQAETYQRKEQQAREWAAGGFVGSAPSFIAAEAEALNVPPQTIANDVIQLADYWSNVKGPAIEATRRKWKVAIEAAGTDVSAVEAALNEGLASLGAM